MRPHSVINAINYSALSFILVTGNISKENLTVVLRVEVTLDQLGKDRNADYCQELWL